VINLDFGQLLALAIATIFINNFVLARFLGLCPFLGVSKQISSAVGMGLAVIFVMTLASIVTWTVYVFVLDPLEIVYLRTIAFILVIATLVQLVEMVIEKTSPALYKALGIYLPLITTNCAVLGVAVLNIDSFVGGGTPPGESFASSLVQGFSAGIGFTLALILMAGIRERLDKADVPEAMKGLPIAFVTAGIMAMAFMGFSGLKLGG
jgi:electron transport complex protein RnfA